MLLYLDLAWKEKRPATREEAREAVVAGAVKRIRPKIMTSRPSCRPSAGALVDGHRPPT